MNGKEALEFKEEIKKDIRKSRKTIEAMIFEKLGLLQYMTKTKINGIEIRPSLSDDVKIEFLSGVQLITDIVFNVKIYASYDNDQK